MVSYIIKFLKLNNEYQQLHVPIIVPSPKLEPHPPAVQFPAVVQEAQFEAQAEQAVPTFTYPLEHCPIVHCPATVQVTQLAAQATHTLLTTPYPVAHCPGVH